MIAQPIITEFSELHPKCYKECVFFRKIDTFCLSLVKPTGCSLVENDRSLSFQGAPDWRVRAAVYKHFLVFDFFSAFRRYLIPPASR
jgi:hypothetical protein